MPAKLVTCVVGPWPMNAYVITCEETGACAIVDPGADAHTILAAAAGRVQKILITHGHFDHVEALAEVQAATGAPLYMHPADAQKFGLAHDVALQGGETVEVGNLRLRAIHTPGHTPGMLCYALGDGRVLVGDTLFVGGPGHSDTPADFALTMRTMREIVFAWPDSTAFYPGHGPSGTIGQERPAFEAFLLRGWAPETCGDVAWQAPPA